VTVEFPAYSTQVESVRDALAAEGFAPDGIRVSRPFVRA